MGLERYVVDAVVLEGRSPTEIARLHGISRSWLYRLLGRYREGGHAGLGRRSRRPHSCSHQTLAASRAGARCRAGLSAAAALVHDVVRQASTMSREMTLARPTGVGRADAMNIRIPIEGSDVSERAVGA